MEEEEQKGAVKDHPEPMALEQTEAALDEKDHMVFVYQFVDSYIILIYAN